MSEALIRTFLDLLYPPAARAAMTGEAGEPFVTFSAADPKVKAGALRSYHFQLSDQEAEAAAEHLDGEGFNVYIGLGLHDRDLGHVRGKKSDVKWLPGFWVDIDLAGPGHAATNLPPTVEDAAGVLAGLGIEPSIAVSTGGGLHLYWLLLEPLAITDENRDRIGKLSKAFQGRIQELFEAVPADRGGPWHVDSTADITRILRPTGTRNWKIGTDGTPIEGAPFSVEFLGDPSDVTRYPLEALSLSPSPVAAPKAKAPETRALVPVSPTQVLPPRPPGTSRLKPDRAKIEFLIGQHRTQEPVGHEPAPTALAPAPTYSLEALTTAAADQSALSGVPVDVLGLRKRLIIQDGETFYPLRRDVNGCFSYRNGIARGALPSALREEITQWPEVLEHPSDPDGHAEFFRRDVFKATGPRAKTTAEIVQELATVAENGVTYDASIPRSYYDPRPERRQLRLSIWQPRPEILSLGEPDPLVVEYFDLFDNPLLLDWLAMSSQKLAEPTSILTVVGPTGAGKNMIAHGIARQWSEEGPVAAKQFLATFNTDFIRCPVVQIDEDLPTDPATGRRLTTARLREISGESTFPIGIKFRNTATLKGAARLVVTINDLEAITTFNEDLNAHSLDAIASRFLIVKIRDAHASFLQKLGGRKFTTDNNWLDKIAAYSLHLAKTRDVTRGSRFLVNGDGAALVGQMASSGSVASLILLMVATHVRTPIPAIKQHGAIRFGGGKILVNGDALVSSFGEALPNERRPQPRLLLKALTPLCDAEVIRPRDDTGKRLRYRALKLHDFYAWADTQDIDVETLRARVETPEAEQPPGKVITGVFTKAPPTIGVVPSVSPKGTP